MRDYQQLAPSLQGLRPDAQAKVFYDLFADALVWSDELPAPGSHRFEEFSPAALRGVWHYRSSLILGQPEERFRAAWEEAEKWFPNWPGFDPQRRDSFLAETLKTMQTAAMKQLREGEDNVNGSHAELSRKATG